MRTSHALDYKTYDAALKGYSPRERWFVFDGSPDRFNIAHECIDRHPASKPAIRVKQEDGSAQSFTFGEISSLSNRFANMLAAAGIRRGDRVATILEPSLQFHVSLFGCLKRGAISVVCSPLLGSEALKFMIDNSKPTLIVADSKRKNEIRLSPSRFVSSEDFQTAINHESDYYEPNTTAEDVAVIQYTSGTTGNPKSFPYKHKALVTLAPYARFAYGIREEDRCFCTSAVGWGHFMWGGTFAPLIFGATTATRSGKFDAKRTLEALGEFRINNITMTPTACRKLVSVENVGEFHLSLERATYTGEPMDIETYYAFKTKFGIEPFGLYGSTEAGTLCAFCRI